MQIDGDIRMSLIHQILKNLLAERVPIRDLETILQTIIDSHDRIQNLSILTEYVRTALSRTICDAYRDTKRRIHLVSLDPALEEYLKARMDFDQFGVMSQLEPQVTEIIINGLTGELKKLTEIGYPEVLITTAPQLRAGLRQITARSMPRLAVLCINEITPETQIVSRGYLSAEILRPWLQQQQQSH